MNSELWHKYFEIHLSANAYIELNINVFNESYCTWVVARMAAKQSPAVNEFVLLEKLCDIILVL